MPSTSTIAHRGRLIAKTQRQPACSTRKPPRNGPMATAMPASPAQVPIAAGRSALRNDAWMIARAPGREQRGGDALEHPEDDQLQRRLGERAQRAADREAGDADQVDASAAEPVAERSADEDQRGEADQVAVGDPLQLGQRGAEVGADAAQRDVDDGAVEHGDAGAEGDREQGEPAEGGAAGEERGRPPRRVRSGQSRPEARVTFSRSCSGVSAVAPWDASQS